ncbi:hypothetical protein [Actinomadura atramentaria]|uniref:hypothetical protein n=1 Tax=Actinomadura atramentaria TaxID=1990 RepID=UPI0003AA9E1A|nr:hypothetical protein [Actinomadura atramentaria]
MRRSRAVFHSMSGAVCPSWRRRTAGLGGGAGHGRGLVMRMSDPVFEAIRDRLMECSDGEALLADGFEAALIGTAVGWFGRSHRTVALYDLALCLHVLVEHGMDEEEADEWIGFNLTGAYAGPGTPVFAIVKRQPVIVED